MIFCKGCLAASPRPWRWKPPPPSRRKSRTYPQQSNARQSRQTWQSVVVARRTPSTCRFTAVNPSAATARNAGGSFHSPCGMVNRPHPNSAHQNRLRWAQGATDDSEHVEPSNALHGHLAVWSHQAAPQCKKRSLRQYWIYFPVSVIISAWGNDDPQKSATS